MTKVAQSSATIHTPQLKCLVDHPLTTLPDQATVFLTGATGFLGIELLRQLLRNSSIKSVITLVRSRSAQHGLARIKKAARIFGWWREEDAAKIEVWPGDLGAAKMGLTSTQWDRLTGLSEVERVVDAIVHNGAVVNWNADYDKLWASNIDSTVQLLNATLCSPARPKFVFVSGGIEGGHQGVAREILAARLSNGSGYCQTKFICDMVVEDVVKCLPVGQNRISSVKPGRIIGPSDTGICNVDDFIWRIVAGAALIGAHPVDAVGTWIHIADVVTVATVILDQIFTSDEAIEPFVNIPNGMTIRVFWKMVNSELDSPCAPLSWAEWTQRSIASLNEIGERHPLWPVQHFLQPFGVSRDLKEREEEEASEEVNIAIKSSVRYLKRIGFIQSSAFEAGGLSKDIIRRKS